MVIPGPPGRVTSAIAVVRINLQLAERRQWVDIFNGREFALLVSHDDPPDVGESVRLDLTVGAGGPRVILRGHVLERSVSGTKPRVFKMALGRYEREKVSYLSGYVRGGLLDLREMRRLPIRLAVTYRGRGTIRRAYTRDINEAGLFVVDQDPLPEQSKIQLELEIPGRSEPLALAGTVSHTVVVEDEDVPGMGIRLDRGAEVRAELEAVVDELERRFTAGDLPEEALL